LASCFLVIRIAVDTSPMMKQSRLARVTAVYSHASLALSANHRLQPVNVNQILHCDPVANLDDVLINELAVEIKPGFRRIRRTAGLYQI
jgi:hypothetical protein